MATGFRKVKVNKGGQWTLHVFRCWTPEPHGT